MFSVAIGDSTFTTKEGIIYSGKEMDINLLNYNSIGPNLIKVYFTNGLVKSIENYVAFKINKNNSIKRNKENNIDFKFVKELPKSFADYFQNIKLKNSSEEYNLTMVRSFGDDNLTVIQCKTDSEDYSSSISKLKPRIYLSESTSDIKKNENELFLDLDEVMIES